MKFKDRFTLASRCGVIMLSKFKSFEYQFENGSFMEDDPFELNFAWTRKKDHAGISLIFGIKWLFWINLSIYDHRHWDRNTDSWETPILK